MKFYNVVCYVVVNFLFQLVFIFPLFLGMVNNVAKVFRKGI